VLDNRSRPTQEGDAVEFHEAAEIFPLLQDGDLDALADDIEKNGLQIPVEILDGKIIDGRNRYRACLMRGVEPDVVEVEADDPVAYVLSMNLHRRHLDTSQKSMVAAKARGWYDQQAKERQKRKPKSVPENLPEQKADARDDAGKAVGVSGKTVDHATTVLERGSKPLQQAVDAGKIPVSSAAKLVDLPKAEQTRIAKSENPKAEARKARPDWAKGPTPTEQAEASPGRRWSAAMHKLYVFMNSTRDAGGIKSLAGKWPAKMKKEYTAELKRIVGEVQKWISILEK
jgi:ParB-like chromosome segregation protein Spo0J